MLHNPPFADAIYLAVAQGANALVFLPDLQAHPGRHVLAFGGAYVFNHNILLSKGEVCPVSFHILCHALVGHDYLQRKVLSSGQSRGI